MQKNTIVVAVVALVLGLGVGYGLSANSRVQEKYESANGTHMMPGGHMMANGGSMDMDDMMASMNAELQGKSGDAFDQAFLSEMIVHHEGAVEMAKLALQGAKHQEIKDLATAIISAQNKEIGDMKSWQKSWYGR